MKKGSLTGKLAGTDWNVGRKSEALSAERYISAHGKKLPLDQPLYVNAFRSARHDADAEAQHGPVKILWKDGKPVG